jgi:hypothetical protein
MTKAKEIVIDESALVQFLSGLTFESVEQVKAKKVTAKIDDLDGSLTGFANKPCSRLGILHEMSGIEIGCFETTPILPGDLYLFPEEAGQPVSGEHVIRTLPMLGNGTPGIAGRKYPFLLTLLSRSQFRQFRSKQGQLLCRSEDTIHPSMVPPQKLADGTCYSCPYRKPEDRDAPKCSWCVPTQAIIWTTATNEDGSAKKSKGNFFIQPVFVEIFLTKTKLGIHINYWSKMTPKNKIYGKSFLAQMVKETDKVTNRHWYAFEHKGVIETPANLQSLCVKVREELLRPYLAELKAKANKKKADDSFEFGANTTDGTEDYNEAMDSPE